MRDSGLIVRLSATADKAQLRPHIKGLREVGLHIRQYKHHRVFLGARQIAADLADGLLPPACLTCDTPLLDDGAEHWHFCTPCETQLIHLADPLCDICGVTLRPDMPVKPEPEWFTVCQECKRHPRVFVKARAPFAHTHTGRRLVLSLKRGHRFRVARWMTPIFLSTCADVITPSEVIVPVPLSRRRLLRRRFNQAALLGLHLARATGLPLITHSLVRVQDTSKQVGQSYQQRYANVAKCFAVVNPELVAGKRVLLLDDVLTSGATANVCTETLLRAGAHEVRVLSISRRLRGFGFGDSPPRLLSPAERGITSSAVERDSIAE